MGGHAQGACQVLHTLQYAGESLCEGELHTCRSRSMRLMPATEKHDPCGLHSAYRFAMSALRQACDEPLLEIVKVLHACEAVVLLALMINHDIQQCLQQHTQPSSLQNGPSSHTGERPVMVMTVTTPQASAVQKSKIHSLVVFAPCSRPHPWSNGDCVCSLHILSTKNIFSKKIVEVSVDLHITCPPKVKLKETVALSGLSQSTQFNCRTVQ